MTSRDYNMAVDQYADGVFRFALKHLKNESDARDIVQETYIKVWEKKSNIAGEKVKSYLFTTAYHSIVDWVKTEKRQGAAWKDEMAGQTEQAPFDLKETLDRALDQLPLIQKTVVLLRDYEGYSYHEIGEICELTEAQVKVYIFRARQTLKGILKEIEYLI
ncbi:MAG: RNA polymerase sigma factor [Bacteroidetes bacterium]|nr:RNA polymerase sigma factor [Bacteroidota bacterium]